LKEQPTNINLEGSKSDASNTKAFRSHAKDVKALTKWEVH
jgi:hypothetical protein